MFAVASGTLFVVLCFLKVTMAPKGTPATTVSGDVQMLGATDFAAPVSQVLSQGCFLRFLVQSA